MADSKEIKITTSFEDEGGGESSPIASSVSSETQDLIKKLLASESFSTEPATEIGEKLPRRKRKAKEEEEEATEEVTRSLDRLRTILDATHQAVIGLNGANGRLTKAFAVIRRSTHKLGDALDAAREKAAQAEEAQGKAGQAASTVGKSMIGKGFGKALKFAGSALGRFGAALGAAGGAAAVLAVAAVGTTVALKLLVGLVNNLKDVVGNFSGALKGAEAVTRAALIQERIKSAGRVGGELSVLEDASREAQKTLIQLKTELIDLFSPLIEAALIIFRLIGQAIIAILKALNFVSELIERIFVFILDKLENIPLVGGIFKQIKDWINKDEIRSAQQDGSISRNLEELFDSENFQNNSKDQRHRRFFPRNMRP